MRYALLLVLAVAPCARAANADLTVELPRLEVAEYHRPYVAVWIEREDHAVAADVAVWYQSKNGKDPKSGKSEPGSKWLSDLRQWWRRSGRDRTLPIDGVSGATRPAGQHQLRLRGDAAPLSTLQPGTYALVVEAARETGGHELVRVPFAWPPTATQHLDAKGEAEIGAVRLDLDP